MSTWWLVNILPTVIIPNVYSMKLLLSFDNCNPFERWSFFAHRIIATFKMLITVDYTDNELQHWTQLLNQREMDAIGIPSSFEHSKSTFSGEKKKIIEKLQWSKELQQLLGHAMSCCTTFGFFFILTVCMSIFRCIFVREVFACPLRSKLWHFYYFFLMLSILFFFPKWCDSLAYSVI